MIRILPLATAAALLAGAADTGLPTRGRRTILQPVLEMRDAIDRGVRAHLEGAGFGDAFPGWIAEYPATADRVRDEMKAHGAATARTLWIEVTASFQGPGGSMRLYAHVLTSGEDARMVKVSYTEAATRYVPLADLPAAARPLGRALEAIRESAHREEEPPDVIAGEEDIERLVPDERNRAAMLPRVEGSREAWKGAWKRLREIRPERVSLYLDDVEILVRDAARREVGVLKADFDTKTSDAAFEWAFEKFRPRNP